jgi:hypothetical protein
MNEIESKKKKRKRSDTYSSGRSRSRSRSRSERKKSKKSKKKDSKSKSKREEKRKRSRSKKTSKKKDKKRSRSPSSSVSQQQDYMNLKPINPHFMYPGMMSMRPPMMPPFHHPMATMKPIAMPEKKPEVLEQPPDKIVKDQNFLNSDEKLFDSIINNEMHLRSVFNDSQISEAYLGQTLYKSVKKFIHDPNTIIFDQSEASATSQPKASEVLGYVINDLVREKKHVNLGDMTHIREQLYNYKNRLITEEINNL